MPSYIPLNSHGTLNLTGFNTYAELKAAKLRAQNKGFGIAWAGKVSKVKEWQANRWVMRSERYKDYGDGLGLLINGKGKVTALESLQTAVAQIGNPPFILIWNG